MSKVFFTDLHCSMEDSRFKKFMRLIKESQLDSIDFKDKFVAIKLHFGEWGNMAFLRHQYARLLCDYLKALGARPFLTDCSTLYPGARDNAINHLDTAYSNGYNPLCTGVHTIIADGLRGTDERLVPVAGGEYVKEAHIGAALAEADIIISLTHFKGHIEAGTGGVLKNIGMGGGSKKGKMEMHSHATPLIKTELCVGCGMCTRHCANDGVHIVDKKAVIDEAHCLGCGHCFAFCTKGAIQCRWDESNPVLSMKIAEYTKAILDGKPAFHISFVTDVTPYCDCMPGNDVPTIPDVGIFAGFDPVALDQACADAVNKQPVFPDSLIGKKLGGAPHGDLFKVVNPKIDWEAGLVHAEKLGLGTRAYELVTVR